MTQTAPITTATFDNLAFPVAKVSYSDRGWTARIRRDSDRTYRAVTSYDHSRPTGAANAITAALACLAKALKDNNPDASTDDYVAIPGDLDEGAYSFTFVPAYIFNG